MSLLLADRVVIDAEPVGVGILLHVLDRQRIVSCDVARRQASPVADAPEPAQVTGGFVPAAAATSATTIATATAPETYGVARYLVSIRMVASFNGSARS